MLFRFLLLSAALAAAFPTYAASAQFKIKKEKVTHSMLLIVEKDNERTIEILAGASFRIRLPENASTGYQWAVDHFDGETLELVSTEPHYGAKALGSGGEVEFVVKGKRAGAGEIELKKWRQWEGDASVIERFHLRVNVLP